MVFWADDFFATDRNRPFIIIKQKKRVFLVFNHRVNVYNWHGYTYPTHQIYEIVASSPRRPFMRRRNESSWKTVQRASEPWSRVRTRRPGKSFYFYLRNPSRPGPFYIFSRRYRLFLEICCSGDEDDNDVCLNTLTLIGFRSSTRRSTRRGPALNTNLIKA